MTDGRQSWRKAFEMIGPAQLPLSPPPSKQALFASSTVQGGGKWRFRQGFSTTYAQGTLF
jgi:hypothetical protein